MDLLKKITIACSLLLLATGIMACEEKETTIVGPLLFGTMNNAPESADRFGYRWVASTSPGGLPFNWVDIRNPGRRLSLGDDDFEAVTLPFSFSFYGVSHSLVRVSSNGYLTFGNAGSELDNRSIPDASIPNNLIAVFWDDLDLSTGGTVHVFDDVTNNRFIVQYTNVPLYSNVNSGMTFQALLYTNDQIVFQYQNMQGETNNATVGIENADGSDGVQIAFNSSFVGNSLAVWILK